MHALVAGRWIDGLLDYARLPDQWRIEVIAWRALREVDELYFERPRQIRKVGSYAREIGLGPTLLKVRSRLGERLRNDKALSCGLGVVTDGPLEGAFAAEDVVVFIAPCHPWCLERVVLDGDLVTRASQPLPSGHEHQILQTTADDDWHGWGELAGWDPESGSRPDPLLLEQARERAIQLLTAQDWANAARLTVRRGDPPRSRIEGSSLAPAKPTAALYGLGNYAKTAILPNIARHLQVTEIHERDPLQIGPRPDTDSVTWDTAPTVPCGGRQDAYLIAGFHHTHSPLAVEALRRGACAVVEKPLAVRPEQLDALLSAMRESSGRVFACFHKRYSRLNDFARKDLARPPGEPVDYHCVVSEEVLPSRHWYRWPASGSRLVSNGCHWTDHFLFLNGFSKPVRWEVVVASNGTVSCSAELENGAFFTMTLTEIGSQRLGVRDHVELRAGGRTVTMVDGSRYTAESDRRVLRRLRVNKLEAYRRMYQAIGRAIAADSPGDPVDWIETTGRLTLNLEAEVGSRNRAMSG